MSGPRTKPPKSDAEWARDTGRRIEGLENPVTARVGDWVLSTDPVTGALLASYVNGGAQVVCEVPAVGADPDAVVDTRLPYLKLRREDPQDCPANTSTIVQWDTIDKQVGGWSFGTTENISQVTIPTDGVYLLVFKLAWTQNTVSTKRATVRIDGVMSDSHELTTSDIAISPTNYITNTYDFNAGQVLDFAGHSVATGTGNRPFGPSIEGTSHTSLTLACLQRA